MKEATTGLPATRGRWRQAFDTFAAYFRLNVVEEAMFPGSEVFRYVALMVPVVTYFFQSEFLGARALYSSTLVGISVAAGLQFSLAGFAIRLEDAQASGKLETYLTEPVPWRFIPLAMNVWPSIVGVLLTCAMLLVGQVLGAQLDLARFPTFLLILLLGVVACNAVGMLAASYLVLFKRSEPVFAVYGFAASILGGALFSINVLPGWLKWMSYLVPHAYVIGAERTTLVKGAHAGGISAPVAVVTLAVFSFLGLVVGLRVFDAALQYARRLGILSH